MHNRTSQIIYKVALPSEMAVVCATVDIFILLSNALTILTFRKLKDLKIQHYYMIGLIGSDLTILIVNTIATVFFILGEIRMTDTTCFLLGSLFVVAAAITAMIHTCFSIDRWVSVAYPTTYRNLSSSKKFHKLTIIVITMIHIIPWPLLFLTWYTEQVNFYFEPYVPFCIRESGEKGNVGVYVGLIIKLVLPCLIEVPSNTYIIWKITMLKGANKARTLKAVRTVLVTLGVYYICWLPMCVWTMWDIVSPNKGSPGWLRFSAIQILNVNSGMSFLIYYLTLQNFRETFLAMLSKCCRKT